MSLGSTVRRAQVAQQKRRLPDAVLWLAIPAFVVLVGLFVIPLGTVGLDSVTTESGISLSRYQDLIDKGFFIPIMMRTIFISATVHAVSIWCAKRCARANCRRASSIPLT